MEFWLTFDNGKEKIHLPVPPSAYSVNRGMIVAVENVNDFGELALIGKRKLRDLTLTSFFPAQKYPFCQTTPKKNPYDYVKQIERWRDSGKPCRLLITDTDINMPVAIENFTTGEKDGSGDVYFDLALKEYRFVKVEDKTKNSSRPSNKTVKKGATYTAKKGDTLITIAKKVYNDSSKYKTLMDKNKLKPNMILRVGQVLKI